MADNKTNTEAGKVAIKKLLTGVSPGDHPFDVVLRIKGTLRKGKDNTQVVAQAACPYTLLAVALNKLNEATKVTVADLVGEVEALDDDARKALRDGLKGDTVEAMEAIGTTVSKMVSGKTTFPKLEVAVEDPNAVESEAA
jgi:hypothetical protein